MADLISHWLLGKRILNDDSFAEAYPFLDREAFLWGCQGPDILFFHRMMPWQSGSLRPYGSSIHKGDPAAVLRSLSKICRYCADRQDYALILSYSMGFCCHYCYDRLVHPLVHYNIELLEKTDERGNNYNYHALIESNYDLMLLRQEKGLSINDLDITECLPECQGFDKAAALLYSLLLCDLYGVHTPIKLSMTLAEDFRSAVKLRKDSLFIKKPVAELAERLLPYVRPGVKGGALACRFYTKNYDTGFDYANITNSVWFDPRDKSFRSNASFFDLTSMAQFESKALIDIFVEDVTHKGCGDFESFTGGVNFSGIKWDMVENK